MTYPPAGTPGFTPRQRDLDFWLSADAAGLATPGITTALRAMAWNRSQQRGLAGAVLGVGIALTGGGLLAAAAGGIGAAAAVGIPGVVLVILGVSLFARIRQRKLPRITMTAPSRAPSKLSSGIGLGVFFTVMFGVILYPLAGRLMESVPAGAVLVLGYAVLLVVLMGSVFTLPSYFMTHAVRDFKADIAASPDLRRALESLAQTWRDPVGSREFGPL